MIFSSLTFLMAFLPLTILLYYLVPKKLKNIILLIASLIFYAWGEPIYVLLMLYSILMNYVAGLLMEKHKNHKKEILVFAIIINLFLLGFFKYSTFLAESINQLTAPLGFVLPIRKLALPIGISFYTFQALSYVIDLYREKFPAQRSFVKFAVYITMFPQLIAGPIVRYETVLKELENRQMTISKLSKGVLLFIEGLAMKVILANMVGQIFDEILALSSVSVVTAWVGALAYTFQIYFDFAGYSQMAIGLGHMLGFTFSQNFNHPYMSTSVTEFWRRWHISLGTWFREYVYIPLGGNRVSAVRHMLNIMIVWLLTGLWHGAAWNFIIWGLYYGCLLLLEKYLFSKLPIPKPVGWVITIILVIVGWVFFSHDTLPMAFDTLKAMIGVGTVFFDTTALYYLTTGGAILLICAIASTPLLKKLVNKLVNITALRPVVGIIYIALFVISIMFIAVDNYNPFLYFRF